MRLPLAGADGASSARCRRHEVTVVSVSSLVRRSAKPGVFARVRHRDLRYQDLGVDRPSEGRAGLQDSDDGSRADDAAGEVFL